MPKLFKITLSSFTALLLVSGCSIVGPNFNGVEKIEIPDSFQSDKDKDKPINKTNKWWESFNDSTLNTLVEKTYAQNLDIKSAGLRILQSRAVLGISEGLSYPQRQTLSGGLSSNRSGDYTYGAIGAGFDLGWEMDVWGKYARGIESSEATLYASIASYNDIMVSIIAELSRNYINYRTAEERLAYAQRNITIQENVTRITEIQFNTGNVSELDMQQSLAQLHRTRSSLPGFKLSMIKAQNAIAVLIGVSAHEIEKIIRTQKKDDFVLLKKKRNYIQLDHAENSSLNISIIPKLNKEPTLNIDANTLANRPDLKVAEHIAHANSANIGLSEAELYPSFTLFGSIGLSSNNIDGSWSSLSDSIHVSVGPAFSWNILQYGRIKNKIRLQDAIFEESLNNYNKKVLQALSEVSDSIHSYTLTKEQQAENEKAVNATVRAFNISMVQYNDGLVGYQRLFNAVDNLTRYQDRYAQVKGSLAISIIALYKSLGGGWQMSQGQPYITQDTVDKMKKRTDWGNYLDSNTTRLPKENK